MSKATLDIFCDSPETVVIYVTHHIYDVPTEYFIIIDCLYTATELSGALPYKALVVRCLV